MSFVATKAQIGYATTIGFSAVGGTSSTTIGELIGITAPKLTVADVDTSRFDSDVFNNLPVEDSIPGWVSPGEWGFKTHYDKASSQYNALRGAVGIQKQWTVTRPDGAIHAFKGYLNELGDEIPLKDKMTVDFKLKINGGNVGTFTVGS